ncbi:alpha/beta hydrolase [Phanerochaete sordida]|uniref:Alpha/beta hydrolase n=1 Tax=Phanerochaete sordida TaxID=48140 RepID=A0A9P3LCQ0_9APHY|nr:alpha/beta hydrolase [Phanerochaete sordida]
MSEEGRKETSLSLSGHEGPSPNAFLYRGVVWRSLVFICVCTVAKVALGLSVIKYSFPPQEAASTTPEDPEVVWQHLPPSSVDSLQWVPCYAGKQCARLMVPLDYSVPNGPKAGIAMIKVPSKLSAEDENYRGPVLFNPGGPGISGVISVHRFGNMLQRLIGDEFDVVGFDPRGIAHTTPRFDVFADAAEAAAWRIRAAASPALNTTPDALSRWWAQAQVLGAVANRTTRSSSPYVSTASVARDMYSIVRAHGLDKLQYWGGSYGTVLGLTYAAMFPDKVQRLLIDAVVDIEDYYSGFWSNNLLDTDRGLRMVLQACVAAGPAYCSLYEPSTAAVYARFSAILNTLKRRPLAVYNNKTGTEYGLVDYTMTRSALFELLYSPYSRTKPSPGYYPAMEFLYALERAEKGFGLELGRITGVVPPNPEFTCDCPDEPSRRPPPPSFDPQAGIAIRCTDADAARAEDTVEELEEYFARLRDNSEFTDIWTPRVDCAGWRVRPVERFAGPFSADTSSPILFIGNTADPATPLANARRMSQAFNNSVVLHQDSAGHGSLAATSLCTAKAIRAYFKDGKLPPNGTVCGVESRMFPVGTEIQLSLQGEDREVMDAWRGIRASVEIPKLGRSQ